MSTRLPNLAGWRGDALALAGGMVLPFAFAPYNLLPLVFAGVAALFISWLAASPGRAFWRGWLFGLALFGIGVSWVHISMSLFGGVGNGLSVFLTTLFVLFLALFPAVVGYLGQRLFPRFAARPAVLLLVIFPALWLLVEWLRGRIMTGFPWLSLGYSQIDTPLAGWAPLLGVFGISMAVLLTVGLLVTLYLQRSSWKWALPGLLALWLLPLGLAAIDWSTPSGKPLTVSLVQGNISQDRKWLPRQRIPTLDLYANLSREHWTSDVIIWPETALPAFYHQVKPYLDAVAQEARMNGAELVIGLPVYDTSAKRYYNSMMNLGGAEGFYEKRHLVPFGEYLPLPGLLGGFIDFFSIPMSNFYPGNDELPPTLKVAGEVAGISICYEDAFGEEVIQALPQASWLINASNDAWFGESAAPHQHLQIARMRALETARYLVRATNTGVSAVIDQKGVVRSRSPQFETHVLTDQVQPLQGLTPYALFANGPMVFLALIMLLVVGWLNRMPGRSPTDVST